MAQFKKIITNATRALYSPELIAQDTLSTGKNPFFEIDGYLKDGTYVFPKRLGDNIPPYGYFFVQYKDGNENYIETPEIGPLSVTETEWVMNLPLKGNIRSIMQDAADWDGERARIHTCEDGNSAIYMEDGGLLCVYREDGTVFEGYHALNFILPIKRLNVFHGAPGCGKSTLLKNIKQQMLRSRYKHTAFPVEKLISVLDLDTTTITEHTDTYKALKSIACYIEWGMQTNKMVFIDEVGANLHPSIKRKLINALLERSIFSSLTFFLTTTDPIIVSEIPSTMLYEIHNHKIYGSFCATLGASLDTIEKTTFKSRTTYQPLYEELGQAIATAPKTEKGLEEIATVFTKVVRRLALNEELNPDHSVLKQYEGIIEQYQILINNSST